jgi:hypothetical protein
MKINGPGAPAAPSAARRTSGAAAEGFSFSTAGAAGQAAATARPGAAAGVSSLSALLALQDVEGPTERRRRSIGRADRILDRLDALKLSLLEGGVTAASLGALNEAVRDQRAMTDDPGLEGVLDQIELRAAVELAKFERARAA